MANSEKIFFGTFEILEDFRFLRYFKETARRKTARAHGTNLWHVWPCRRIETCRRDHWMSSCLSCCLSKGKLLEHLTRKGDAARRQILCWIIKSKSFIKKWHFWQKYDIFEILEFLELFDSKIIWFFAERFERKWFWYLFNQSKMKSNAIKR